jgi:hypothetical protein
LIVSWHRMVIFTIVFAEQDTTCGFVKPGENPARSILRY